MTLLKRAAAEREPYGVYAPPERPKWPDPKPI